MKEGAAHLKLTDKLYKGEKMTYQKTLWKDQNVERPKTYEMTNNADGSFVLVESFGEVLELGTPVNAQNMNNIEEGIDELYNSGIPSYDETRTYNNQSIVKDFDEDDNLILYKSLVNSNSGNLLSNETYWKKIELNKKEQTNIGNPILTLSSTLGENEIWLEGATVSRTTYSNLFSIYGTTYGAGDGSTTFKLPDFKNKAVWGANTFGTLSAGLPNISGHMGFTGTLDEFKRSDYTGPFYRATSASGAYRWWFNANTNGESGTSTRPTATFDASRANSIYGKSTTVQPAAIKVRVKTKYR